MPHQKCLLADLTTFNLNRATAQNIAIEFTFNWYWLVDGLLGEQVSLEEFVP